MSKSLVVYFSATGVTKKIASKLSEKLGADLFEIVPKELYTSEDLDWKNPQSRSSLEMGDFESRPEIQSKISDINQYSTIFLGFPIWWYQAPTIISTFLESYDFTGKTLSVFATSGGSRLGQTETILKQIVQTAHWKPGLLINKWNDTAISSWIDSVEKNN